MSYLVLDGNRHQIPVGEAVIGSDPGAFVVISGEGVLAQHAVVVSSADGQSAVRLADASAVVSINGVQLGPQPHPLLHGDKIEVAGRDLTYVDERRSGSTQFVSADDIAKLQALGQPGGGGPEKPAKATAGTGGRLVSLTDGREYVISGPSLVLGRDAGCDVVVAQKRVSRRHAEIIATPKGYILADMSSNGTFVNSERVTGERVLSRADVIRVGDDEFRFYADAAAARPATPPAGAEFRLGDTLHGVPGFLPPKPGAPPPPASPPPAVPEPSPTAPSAAVPQPPAPAVPAESAPPPAPGTLANLIVRSGQLKGHRFPIRVPVVNIGRAEYNDIVIPDNSVSSAHGKIQLREGIWIIVDLDSTNGTTVDGAVVKNTEAPLAPGAMVRFGDVSVVFEPTKDDSAEMGGGTKVLGAVDLP